MAYLLSRSLKTNYKAALVSKPSCLKLLLIILTILLSYYTVFLNNPPWSISSSFMIQPVIDLKGEFILFKEGTVNEIITSYTELTPYDINRGKFQMSIEPIDSNNDTLVDVFNVKIDFFETPAEFNAMTVILPLQIYIDGQMRFLMEDYIIFSLDQSFKFATVIGDLSIKQKRLINQNFPISFTYNDTLVDLFNSETLSVKNILNDKMKRDEYVDFKYKVYGQSPTPQDTQATIDILIGVKPFQEIKYYPSGFIALRDGARPFLAVLIPLYLLVERIMTWVLSKGIFLSRRQEDPVIEKLKHKYD